MQSRTSYFNKAIFLNTVKRFWPLWLAYFAVWALVMPVTQSVNYLGETYRAQREVLDIAQQGGIVIGAVYGVLAAMAVWSFMYNSKTMSGVACLPVKREGVFLSATLAGLIPAVVSNIVLFGLTMLVHLGRGYGAVVVFDLYGFAIVTMMLVFFYGFAILCAQLTGNIVILPLVYAVLNFTAVVVESTVNYILDIIVYGVYFNTYGISNFLSPIIGLMQGRARTHETYLPEFDEYVVERISYEGIGFIIVCCIVGIIMLFGAMLIYRRRRMESVGDVVAVEVMKPVFKYCLTFGCALVSSIGFYALVIQNIVYRPLHETIGILVFMLFGAFIGYFAAEMLIRKSFRVFRGHWRGLLVSMLIVCVATLGLEFDILGMERRVPDADDVEHIELAGSDYVCYTECENIEAIVALHESVIENKAIHENSYGYSTNFDVTYYMNDGSRMQRNYTLRYNTLSELHEGIEDAEALENIQNSDEAIAWRKKLPFVPSEENVLGGTFRGIVTNDEMLALNPELTEDELIVINYYGYDEYYVRNEMSEAEKLRLAEEYRLYNDVKKTYGSFNWNFSADEMWELYNECILPDLAEGKIGKLWIIEDEDYFNTVCSGRLAIEFWYYPEQVVGDGHVRVESVDVATVTFEEPATAAEYYIETGKSTYTFSTTPTVGSRTYEWLEEHGVLLHTVGEELELYEGYGTYGKYY